jgi:hypothetical protein
MIMGMTLVSVAAVAAVAVAVFLAGFWFRGCLDKAGEVLEKMEDIHRE